MDLNEVGGGGGGVLNKNTFCVRLNLERHILWNVKTNKFIETCNVIIHSKFVKKNIEEN